VSPKILFVTSTRLGDAVLSTGVLARLIADHPGAEITVVAGTLPAPLFRAVPGLKRLIAIEKRRFTEHWIRVFLDVAPTPWDVFLDLRNVGILHLVRARTAYRYRKNGEGLHKVAENAALLGLAPQAPQLWTDDAARVQAARLLGGRKGFLALAPTAGSVHKEWAGERFADLARRLTGPGFPMAGAEIVIFASEAERARAECVVAALPQSHVIDLTGRTDPLSAAACLAQARLFVGNDSGLMHIAAAAGAPTLGLFGTGSPAIYGPWGPRAAFIERRLPDEERIPLEQSSDPATRARVMSLLSVDEVEAAAIRLLSDI
jgi:lipopolysaccharide export system permease protein